MGSEDPSLGELDPSLDGQDDEVRPLDYTYGVLVGLVAGGAVVEYLGVEPFVLVAIGSIGLVTAFAEEMGRGRWW